jgi:hypothetical protein
MTPRCRVIAAALALGSALGSAEARAADPTTRECLAASEASLKAGNERKLRVERAALLICAAASCPVDVRRECIRRVDEVNAAIPTIIFVAKDAAGSDLGAVKVVMDGEVLAERLDGSALSIDPGARTFRFETAGHAAITKQFVIHESQKNRHEAVVFGSAAAFSAPRSGLGVQKTLAIVAGGLGLASLGVGGAFGLTAMAKKTDAEKTCPHDCPDQSGVNLWNDAAGAGNLSTAAFIVGGVMLAAGTALWFTASADATSNPTAQVGIGPGSIQLRGAW